MALVDYLHSLAFYDGSDLHLASGVPPGMRRYGALLPLAPEILTADEVASVLAEMLSHEALERLAMEKNFDFVYETRLPEGQLARFRGSAYLQRNGPSVVMRRLPAVAPRLDALGLPAVVRSLISYPHGLVVLAGQRGSGKSTVMGALVNEINETRPSHVITLEDPIEFVHSSAQALINQRQIGRDVDSVATGLRGALRESPDVVVIGEMRGPLDVSVALTAAETGHLVLATMNAPNAARAVDRMIDGFQAEQQPQIRSVLADALQAVVVGQLVPRAEGHGLVSITEVLIVTPSVTTLIREGRTHLFGNALDTGRKVGMRTFDDSIAEAYSQGLITREEAFKRATNKDIYQGRNFQPNFDRPEDVPSDTVENPTEVS